MARVVSLLALDFAAIFLAIVTALGLKAAARDVLDVSATVDQAQDYVWFAFLVTALLFARSACTAIARCAPGCRASSPPSSRSPS